MFETWLYTTSEGRKVLTALIRAGIEDHDQIEAILRPVWTAARMVETDRLERITRNIVSVRPYVFEELQPRESYAEAAERASKY
jgi:hypothetical protein